MKTATILVIDDSATIRKLVDSHLSEEGYHVELAPTAELGIELAQELLPDLILLDHQLPGTTGLEVCQQIIAIEKCSNIPFVVSSTLRKQAYAEYLQIPNVIDSLHKPFQPDLLKMTVANALETASMIIQSQSSGAAVPEVINETEKAAISGDLTCFGLREIVDFLNNGQQEGMLEVESARYRTMFFLSQGRIQCVVSPSGDQSLVEQRLPEALKDLSPLLKFTMSTGFSAQMDGLVELLDRKMLDPRLLRSLLRHQAAVLTRHCFRSELQSFSFVAGQPVPKLFRRSPLETSLVSLLVEGALSAPGSELDDPEAMGWTRQGLRGQNLDRTGLAARHVQLTSQLDGPPQSARQLAERMQLPTEEVIRVLDGFAMADWVKTEPLVEQKTALVLEYDPGGSSLFRKYLAEDSNPWSGKVVRDEFGLKLLMKRTKPDVLVLSIPDDAPLAVPSNILADMETLGVNARVGVILSANHPAVDQESAPGVEAVIRRPYSQRDIDIAMEKLAGVSIPEAQVVNA
ncbi:MAG: response regulator [Planctomycetaceae bacterium]|nr:response regulator [Planctomycetaceae bacterium]